MNVYKDLALAWAIVGYIAVLAALAFGVVFDMDKEAGVFILLSLACNVTAGFLALVHYLRLKR